MNVSETARLVAMFQALVPHAQPNKETVTIWHMALDDVPFEAALFAARIWIRERKHFPYPAELREIIAERALNLPSGDEVWHQIVQRVDMNPYDERKKEPFRLPPLAQTALDRIGGIFAVNKSDHRHLMRRDFLETYSQIKREAVVSFDQSTAMDALMGETHVALDEAAS